MLLFAMQSFGATIIIDDQIDEFIKRTFKNALNTSCCSKSHIRILYSHAQQQMRSNMSSMHFSKNFKHDANNNQTKCNRSNNDRHSALWKIRIVLCLRSAQWNKCNQTKQSTKLLHYKISFWIYVIQCKNERKGIIILWIGMQYAGITDNNNNNRCTVKSYYVFFFCIIENLWNNVNEWCFFWCWWLAEKRSFIG